MIAIATLALLSLWAIAWLRPSFLKNQSQLLASFIYFHGLIQPLAIYIAIFRDNLMLANPFSAFIGCIIIAPHPKKTTRMNKTMRIKNL